MDALAVNVLGLEVLGHLEHELLGTADVVLGRAVGQVKILGGDLGQVHAVVVVVGDAREISLGKMSLEDVGLEVGAVAGDAADLLVEGNAAARAVDPRDGTVGLALGDGVEDGHHGSDTDTGGDEDDGDVGGVGHVEVELSSRVSELDNVTLLLHVDEKVGDNAGVEGSATEVSARAAHVKTLITLDGDAVVVRSGSLAHGVLSRLEVSLVGDVEADRGVLAGHESGQSLAILGNKVEGEDILSLLDLLLDAELPEALPLLKVLVELSLASNQHLGEHPVSLGPGLSDLRGHDRTEDLSKSSNQILLNDGVVFGSDTKRAVLVAHALHLGDELCDVVDVVGIVEDDGSEGTGLATVGLVDCVEVVVEFRVVPQHVAVEDGGDALSVVSESGDSSPDHPGLLV